LLNQTEETDTNSPIITIDMKTTYTKIQSLQTLIQSRWTEKISLVQHLLTNITQYQGKLDHDLSHFEVELRGTSDYEIPKSIAPRTQVIRSFSYLTYEAVSLFLLFPFS